jgi:oligopeptide/dipeptide ABC transporter ATP-binding protein
MMAQPLSLRADRSATAPNLEMRDLVKVYAGASAAVAALSNVCLALFEGETLGLVGESGCGKSTLARCLLRLVEPTAGQLLYRGQPYQAASAEEMRALRSKLQIVFQDPFASLHPRMRVGDIVAEPMRMLSMTREQRRERAARLLDRVQLAPELGSRYPHELSGGQRQRVGIARALAMQPSFIVCDEPVSALDVSIQAQIINLLKDLQQDFELTYVFVAHDLGVVRHVSDRIAVMYLGKVVEVATSDELHAVPRHPYTNALLSATAVADPDEAERRHRIILVGDVPSPIDPPSGCRFHPRCPKARERCSAEEPLLVPQEHLVACHFPVEAGEDLTAGRIA